MMPGLRMTGTWRLFFALLPPAEAVAALCRLGPQLLSRCPDARLVEPGHLHLTVLFLGSHDRRPQAAAAQALAVGVQTPGVAFELTLDRCGCFGSSRRSVLWLGPRRAPTALTDLEYRLRSACVAAGLPVEQRPFVPHLTLARRASGGALAPPTPVGWRVDRLALMLSDPAHRYQCLAEFRLDPDRAVRPGPIQSRPQPQRLASASAD